MKCRTKHCLTETKDHYCAACKARWSVEKRLADQARAKALPKLREMLREFE